MDNTKLIDNLIDIAVKEDLGDGDHTSLSCLPTNQYGEAQLLVKGEGILAGVEIAKKVFRKIDPKLNLEIQLEDGAAIKKGDVAFIVTGKQISILSSERLVLNFMQRMSGIATQTNLFARELDGLKTKVLDTRKTTPGLRLIEKMAVKIGGGENHRLGLDDMILIKDNHIDFAGGIENAVSKVYEYLHKKSLDLKIIVEARSIADVEKILKLRKVNRVLLDNFSIGNTKKAVELINGRLETESSGGITFKNLRNYAECSVDYISVGALTHQIKSMDMSLKAI